MAKINPCRGKKAEKVSCELMSIGIALNRMASGEEGFPQPSSGGDSPGPGSNGVDWERTGSSIDSLDEGLIT